MNLLFVVPTYEPAWPFGGVVRSISNLCRGLVALGHGVTVYTTNANGKGGVLPMPCGQPVDLGGVKTYYFPSTLGPKSVLDSRALIEKLRQTVDKFDLVYLSAIWQWLGIPVSSICHAQKVPLIIGPRGSFAQALWQRHRWRKTLYWHGFLRRALTYSSALHLTTEHERKESAHLLRGFTNFIVQNGIDCDFFRPCKERRMDFRFRYGIPFEAPVLITVGRADPKKRVDLLISALQCVPDIHFLIVGPDSYNLMPKWCKVMQHQGVENRLTWTGHLEGEELVQAYSAADIFSLLSEDENFANVVLEALACGLPIVVNRGVGIWEELASKEVGQEVDLHSDAIAAALQDFLRHRKRWASWGEKAIQVARQLFTKEKVAALMAQAFHDVLDGHHSPECRWDVLA